MKRFTTGLILSLCAAGALAAGDPQAGAAKAAECVACHAQDGNSLAPNFPKLAGQGEKYLLKQLKDIKSGARPVPEMMAITPNLSDQDMENLAAYFASQGTSAGAAKPELVAKGAAIFRGGVREKGLPACAGCHSPTGKGNAPAGFPKLAGQHAQYIVTQLKKFQNEERTNDGDSRAMRDVAARMTDKEMEAVASYIAGLR